MNDWTIFKAIELKNITKVKELLDSGVDVNATNQYGNTPLYVGCYYGDTEIVKLLLAHPDIDVNLQNRTRWTALHYLCFNLPIRDNYIEILKLLLARPEIDVNIQNEYGNTALHILLKDRSYDELFIKKIKCSNLILENPRVDINIKNNMNISILSLSLQNGYSDIFKKLLNNSKLKINENDKSLLDEAILFSDIETISLLINKFNITNIRKDILFDVYKSRWDNKIIEYILNTPILKNQLDINIQDDNKDTLLHLTSYNSYDSLKILKLVLDIPNINVNAKNYDGYSPLLLACKHNIIDNVKLFLSHPKIKIDFDYNDPDNYTGDDLVIMSGDDDDEDNTVNIKIRNLLKSHTNNYKNSINKILDSIED